jgi:hypothetical protein
MPCPSHSPWLYHSNYVWRGVQVMKLLITVMDTVARCHKVCYNGRILCARVAPACRPWRKKCCANESKPEDRKQYHLDEWTTISRKHWDIQLVWNVTSLITYLNTIASTAMSQENVEFTYLCVSHVSDEVWHRQSLVESTEFLTPATKRFFFFSQLRTIQISFCPHITEVFFPISHSSRWATGFHHEPVLFNISSAIYIANVCICVYNWYKITGFLDFVHRPGY